jgi:hypothetical protein
MEKKLIYNSTKILSMLFHPLITITLALSFKPIRSIKKDLLLGSRER